MHFVIGESVQFRGRQGKVVLGVVFSANRCRSKYMVRAGSGKVYNVPDRMLESVLGVSGAEAEKMVTAGLDFMDRRAELFRASRKRMGECMKDRTDKLRSGMAVQVYSLGKWSRTEIVRVLPEVGKVTVLNPAAILYHRERIDSALDGLISRLMKKRRDTITVLANRICVM